MDGLSAAWSVTGTIISSRSSADVFFEEQAVRIPGESMCGYFLANPYEMFWLAKEDRELWPWKLPPEKRQDLLPEAERQAVMDAVNAFCKGRKAPICFLTKELEGRAIALAEQVTNKNLSPRKAARSLMKEFPNYEKKFYSDLISASLAGASWYKHNQNTEDNAE